MSKSYIAVVRRNPETELNHADHKYLYKKKVDGKWRYYYEVGNPKSAYANGGKDSGIKGYSKLQDLLGYDERDAYNNARLNANVANEIADEIAELRTNPTESYRYNRDVHKEYIEKGKAYEANVAKNYDSYSKTPLGMIDRIDDKIDAGRNKISDLLKKVAKTVEPKQEELHRHYNRKHNNY